MTDNEFSSHFDANEIVRKATRRIADQTESALRDAVAVELRRQGWTVVPPGEAHTPTELSTEHQQHAEARRDETMTLISHTPTDDERGALRAAVADGTAAYAEAQIPGTYVSQYIADAVLAAGFRRSEVPEPSAERDLTPCGNLVCTGCRVCGCPALGIEPQGEPSDAVANAVARAIIEHDEDRLTCYDHAEDFCCPCGTHGMSRSEWQRHRARAALRAAGGVR